MPAKIKRRMYTWFIIEVVTIIIATFHLKYSPEHHTYAIPLFIALCVSFAVWVVVWLVLQRRS